ncbi:MAG: hypothetical protein JWM05_3269 [Acidimicrobiales bacterium]|nr:hypothetical protein [Acidimicrobiales bacterium]
MSAPMTHRTARAPQRAPQRSPGGAPASTRRPDLRVVEPARRGRAGLVVASSMLLVFAALLASAIFHSVLVTGQQRLDSTDRAVSEQEHLIEQQRLKVAELQSPGRIVVAARSQGMIEPDRTHWVAPPGPDGVSPPAVVTGASTLGAPATSVPASSTGGTSTASTAGTSTNRTGGSGHGSSTASPTTTYAKQ